MKTPRALPKPTVKDLVYAGIKGFVGEFPGGSTGGEVLALAITPPLAKRMDGFLEGLAHDIAELQDKFEQLNAERLSDNELFVTAAVQATQIAVRNHQPEKIDALRNAVVNSAILTEPKDDMVQSFLSYVDTLTVSHIKVLQFFYDPGIWGNEHTINWPNWSMGGMLMPLLHAMPELGEEFARQIIKDLQARGLMTDFNPGATITDSAMFASRTTDMGNSFLDFIKKPS